MSTEVPAGTPPALLASRTSRIADRGSTRTAPTRRLAAPDGILSAGRQSTSNDVLRHAPFTRSNQPHQIVLFVFVLTLDAEWAASTSMRQSVSYVDLLRRIANAEGNAERYLSAWAAATPRVDVRQVIATIALREGEHAKAFEKRLCELGHPVTIEEAEATAGKVEIACSAQLTDCEKFEKLGLGTAPDPTEKDRWTTYFDDSTIDIRTGELLGRFISEERDSVRMLANCYSALSAESSPASGSSTAELETRLDRIESMVEQLLASKKR
jgi:rubrerythrin